MEFETEEQADTFFRWLCVGGAQDFWSYCETHPGERPSVDFDYFAGAAKFLGAGRVVCTAAEPEGGS